MYIIVGKNYKNVEKNINVFRNIGTLGFNFKGCNVFQTIHIPNQSKPLITTIYKYKYLYSNGYIVN